MLVSSKTCNTMLGSDSVNIHSHDVPFVALHEVKRIPMIDFLGVLNECFICREIQ